MSHEKENENDKFTDRAGIPIKRSTPFVQVLSCWLMNHLIHLILSVNSCQFVNVFNFNNSVFLLCLIVYDRNYYFGLGPIPKPKPKPKPKLVDAFSRYHISKGNSSMGYFFNDKRTPNKYSRCFRLFLKICV